MPWPMPEMLQVSTAVKVAAKPPDLVMPEVLVCIAIFSFEIVISVMGKV